MRTSLTLEHPWASPPLGQLVSGCHRLLVDPDILDNPMWRIFLELAQPQHLVLGAWAAAANPSDNAAASTILAGCPALQELTCRQDVKPTCCPPHLRALTVELGYAPPQVVTALLQTLAGLPHLAQLRLWLATCTSTQLPDDFPHMASLRRLSVSVTLCSGPCHLSALSAAAAQGVTIDLSVQMLRDEMADESSDSDEMDLAAREALWAALAELPTLSSLQLQGDACLGCQASPREEQLLANVRCSELVLHIASRVPCCGALVRLVQCNVIFCYDPGDIAGYSSWAWSSLTAKPGVYVIDEWASLTVDSCTGSLPDFEQPWALVLQCLDRVNGLPVDLFHPGPRSPLVWRNSAATDACLVKAFKQLDHFPWAR